MSALLSPADAARLLGISSRRVRKLIQAGRIPAAKVGSGWVINRDDLSRFRKLPAGWTPGRARGPREKKVSPEPQNA